jgi:hypothetical protein
VTQPGPAPRAAAVTPLAAPAPATPCLLQRRAGLTPSSSAPAARVRAWPAYCGNSSARPRARRRQCRAAPPFRGRAASVVFLWRELIWLRSTPLQAC